jgi:hypothetical protein
MRIRKLLALALAALVLAGCSVPLLTAGAPSESCDLALIAGSLERHPQTGLGIATSGEEVTPVQWPFGYSARMEITTIALVDEKGKVVAREHDRVEAGGSAGAGGTWLACGPVTFVSSEGG